MTHTTPEKKQITCVPDRAPALRVPSRSCCVDGCDLPHFAKDYCEPHYARALRNNGDPLVHKPIWRRSIGPEERFWAKVDKNGPIPECRPDLGPCWLWLGSKIKKGYGNCRWEGKVWRAHRVAYLLVHGVVPAHRSGFELDHLCHVRSCVNPAHLEAVTYYVNQERGVGTVIARSLTRTHCPKGHALDETNTYHLPKGGRVCRICQLANQRAWYHRKKAVS